MYYPSHDKLTTKELMIDIRKPRLKLKTFDGLLNINKTTKILTHCRL